MKKVAETVENGCIVGKPGELFKFLGVLGKSVPNTFLEKGGQIGVRRKEPATVENAVGNVGKFPRRHLVEIVKNGLLQNIAVKRRNAVDGM